MAAMDMVVKIRSPQQIFSARQVKKLEEIEQEGD